ncbi:MAG: stage V sporulation protein T [Firmicutes bacterium]|nr:stage V sporulation protein T [Bacillota bacterium]
MKATGIVRRIDDLGRVVIPKEIRRTMRLRDGDPLEIYTDKQGEVILKKYSPIGDMSECAAEFADSASDILGHTAIITDTDHVIAVSGSMRKELKDKKISSRIDDIIQEKNSIMVTDKSEAFFIVDNDRFADEYESQIVVPIISQGDTIGSVIFLSCGNGNVMGETELKAAEVGAAFLAKQMEN